MSLAKLTDGLRRRRPAPRSVQPQSQPELGKIYDVIILGAGGHGLSAAYYLAKNHGITKVVVLDSDHLASGDLGNGGTTGHANVIGADDLTDDGIALAKEAITLYRGLSAELDIDFLDAERGHLTLAHSDADIHALRWRAEVNKHLGVDCELIVEDEIAEICPTLNLARQGRYPVMAGLYHPPGAVLREEVVARGYAQRAMQMGVQLHRESDITGLIIEGNRIKGVKLGDRTLYADSILQTTAGTTPLLAQEAGLRLPLHTVKTPAWISEPLQPFLDVIVVSGSRSLQLLQRSQGELLMSSLADREVRSCLSSSLDFKEGLMRSVLHLMPCLGEVKIERRWSGSVHKTPDFSPLMGRTPIENYFVDVGWGTRAAQGTPIAGRGMAAFIATGELPELLASFNLSRFEREGGIVQKEVA